MILSFSVTQLLKLRLFQNRILKVTTDIQGNFQSLRNVVDTKSAHNHRSFCERIIKCVSGPPATLDQLVSCG